MHLLSRLTLLAALSCIEASALAQGLKAPGSFDLLDSSRLDSARPQWRPGSVLAPEGGFAYSGYADPTGGTVAGGVYKPLSARLSTLFESSYSDSGGLEMERSMLGEVSASFDGGWGVRAGMRHSELGLKDMPLYSPATGPLGSSDLGMLTLERSWDRYRSAYTYYAGRADNGLSASGHRFQVDYFYGERSSVGLAYTAGQHTDAFSVSRIATPWDTSNIGVTGEHWLSESWSLRYDALMEEGLGQGLKPELRLGLRLSF
jgi:hypothetical protein